MKRPFYDCYSPADFIGRAGKIAKTFCQQHPQAKQKIVYYAATEAAEMYEQSKRLKMHSFKGFVYLRIKTAVYIENRKENNIMPKMDDELKSAIIKDYNEGMNCKEIAERYGRDYKTTYNLINKWGKKGLLNIRKAEPQEDTELNANVLAHVEGYVSEETAKKLKEIGEVTGIPVCYKEYSDDDDYEDPDNPDIYVYNGSMSIEDTLKRIELFKADRAKESAENEQNELAHVEEDVATEPAATEQNELAHVEEDVATEPAATEQNELTHVEEDTASEPAATDTRLYSELYRWDIMEAVKKDVTVCVLDKKNVAAVAINIMPFANAVKLIDKIRADDTSRYYIWTYDEKGEPDESD